MKLPWSWHLPCWLVGGEAFAGVDLDIGLMFRACVWGGAEWGEQWDGVDHCLGNGKTRTIKRSRVF